MSTQPVLYASTQPNSAIDQLNAGLGIVFENLGKGVGIYSDFMNAQAAAKAEKAQQSAPYGTAAQPNVATAWQVPSNKSLLYIGLGIVGVTFASAVVYSMVK